MASVTIAELTVADEPAAWAALGFAVAGDVCRVGGVPLRLAGRAAGRGLAGWTLRGATSADLDGLPTKVVGAPAAAPAPTDAPSHPNGVTAFDHLVAVAPALDRSVAALRA
ncbi:MAG TPA: hypothetical protein VFV85_00705, partial [Conexibacter sp.]|nr:hypothetical protein [Conexibacter sp.]